MIGDNNFKQTEQKWRDLWQHKGLFSSDLDQVEQKYYLLNMFPYPKGQKHIASTRQFYVVDAYARYLLLQGYNVLNPFGFDAFGLPAENEARTHGIDPRKWTDTNINLFRKSWSECGIEYERTRELITCEPSYYQWTQWLFLQFYKNGLAYRSTTAVDWCPSCETVLAKEQITDAVCQNCGAYVNSKRLTQWFFNITRYTEELLSGLDQLQWPEHVKQMQRNWIGRVEGAIVRCPFGQSDIIEAFVRQPETLFGSCCVVLVPDHPLLDKVITPEKQTEVYQYLEAINSQSHYNHQRKAGVFSGSYTVNPVTGVSLPIWISDYVELDNTTAYMVVPAHNKEDFAFANAGNLPCYTVINPSEGKSALPTQPYIGEGNLVDAGPFTGLPTGPRTAMLICDFLEERGIGYRQIKYRLHNWLISRQRYWGTPIPIIYCNRCGTVPVPEADLPVILPQLESYIRLDDIPSFTQTRCPICGDQARRETDTMDTFVDSSWYFFRYLSPHTHDRIFEQKKAHHWLPVDLYVGGMHYVNSHLIYARFVTKALRDLGWLSIHEPFSRIFTFGVVQAKAYRCSEHGWLALTEIHDQKCNLCDRLVHETLAKMSRKRRNFVDIADIVEQYGADTARVATLWLGPHDQDLEWTSSSVKGAHRWLLRVQRLINNNINFLNDVPLLENLKCEYQSEIDNKLVQMLNGYIDTITTAVSSLRFHIAISRMMELTNTLYKYLSTCRSKHETLNRPLLKRAFFDLVILLSPVAPFVAEEGWSMLGNNNSIFEQKWPHQLEEYLKPQMSDDEISPR